MQDILKEEIQPIKNIPGFTPSLVIQPLYEAAIRANSERGGSAAGIEADGPLTGTLILTVHCNSHGGSKREWTRGQGLETVSNGFSCSVQHTMG